MAGQFDPDWYSPEFILPGPASAGDYRDPIMGSGPHAYAAAYGGWQHGGNSIMFDTETTSKFKDARPLEIYAREIDRLGKPTDRAFHAYIKPSEHLDLTSRVDGKNATADAMLTHGIVEDENQRRILERYADEVGATKPTQWTYLNREKTLTERQAAAQFDQFVRRINPRVVMANNNQFDLQAIANLDPEVGRHLASLPQFDVSAGWRARGAIDPSFRGPKKGGRYSYSQASVRQAPALQALFSGQQAHRARGDVMEAIEITQRAMDASTLPEAIRNQVPFMAGSQYAQRMITGRSGPGIPGAESGPYNSALRQRAFDRLGRRMMGARQTSGRLYNVGGNHLPSVTTFLRSPYSGPGGNTWAMALGTLTHQMIDHATKHGTPIPKMTGGQYNMLGIASRLSNAWMSHLKTKNPDWKLVGSEIPVVVPGKYAGTIDAIYRDSQGRHHLVDYKTGKKLESSQVDYYTKQLAAYSHPDARMVGPNGELVPLPRFASAQLAHLARTRTGGRAGATVMMRDVTANLEGARAAAMGEWQDFAANGHLADLIARAGSGDVDIRRLLGARLQAGGAGSGGIPPTLPPTPSPSPDDFEHLMPGQGEVPDDLAAADRRLRWQHPEWESQLEPVIEPGQARRTGDNLPEIPMQLDDFLNHAHPDRNPSDPTGNAATRSLADMHFPGDTLHWRQQYGSEPWEFNDDTQLLTRENMRHKYGDDWKIHDVTRGKYSQRLFAALKRGRLYTQSDSGFVPVGSAGRNLIPAASVFPRAAIPMRRVRGREGAALSEAFTKLFGASPDLYREMSGRVRNSLVKAQRQFGRSNGKISDSDIAGINQGLKSLGLGDNAHGLLGVLDAVQQAGGLVSAGGLAAMLPGKIGANDYDTILQQAAALGYGHYEDHQFLGDEQEFGKLFKGGVGPLGKLNPAVLSRANQPSNVTSGLMEFLSTSLPPPQTDAVQEALAHVTPTTEPTAGASTGIWGARRKTATGQASLFDLLNASAPGGPMDKRLLNPKDDPDYHAARKDLDEHIGRIKKVLNHQQFAGLTGRPKSFVSREQIYAYLDTLGQGGVHALDQIPVSKLAGLGGLQAANIEKGLDKIYGSADPAPELAPGDAGGASIPPSTPLSGAAPAGGFPGGGGGSPFSFGGPTGPGRRWMSPHEYLAQKLAGRETKIPEYHKIIKPVSGWDYNREEPSEDLGKDVRYGPGGTDKTRSLKTLMAKNNQLAEEWVARLRAARAKQAQLMEAFEEANEGYGTNVNPVTGALDVKSGTGWATAARGPNGEYLPGLGSRYIPGKHDTPQSRELADKINRAGMAASAAAKVAGASPDGSVNLARYITAVSQGAGTKAYDNAVASPVDGGIGLGHQSAALIGQQAAYAESLKQQKAFGMDQQYAPGMKGQLQKVIQARGASTLTDYVAQRSLQAASWGLSGAAVYTAMNEAKRAWLESLYIQRAQYSLAGNTPESQQGNMMRGVAGLSMSYGFRPEEAYNVAYKMQGYFGQGPGNVSGSKNNISGTLMATKATMLLAKTSTIELSEAMGDLVAITDSFGGGAGTMMKTVDGLVALQNQWGISIEQTVAGLARLGDLFHDFGVKEPMAAAIVSTIVQRTGESGIQVASKLERVLPNLNDPTAQTSVTELGVHYKLFDRHVFMGQGGVDLSKILNSIGGAYAAHKIDEGALTRFAFAIGGTRNSREILAMLSHWGDTKQKEAVFAGASGDAQKRWDKLSGAALEQLRMLEAAFHNLAVSMLSSGVLSMLTVFGGLLTSVARVGNETISMFNGMFDSLGKLPGLFGHIGALAKLVASAVILGGTAGRIHGSERLIGSMPLLGSLRGTESIYGIPSAILTSGERARLIREKGLQRGADGAFTWVPGRNANQRQVSEQLFLKDEELRLASEGVMTAEQRGNAAAIALAPHLTPSQKAAAYNAATGFAGGAPELDANAAPEERKLAAMLMAQAGFFMKGLWVGFITPLVTVTKTVVTALTRLALSAVTSSKALLGGRVSGMIGSLVGGPGSRLGSGLARLGGLAGIEGEGAIAGGLGVAAGAAGLAALGVHSVISLVNYQNKQAAARRQDALTYQQEQSALELANTRSGNTSGGVGQELDIYKEARDNAVKHRGFFGKLATGTVGFLTGTSNENKLIDTAVPGMSVNDLDKKIKQQEEQLTKQITAQYSSANAQGLNWLAPDDLQFRQQDLENQRTLGGPAYVMNTIYGVGNKLSASYAKSGKPNDTASTMQQYTEDLQQLQAQTTLALKNQRIDQVKALRQEYFDTLKNAKDLTDAGEQASAALQGFLTTSGGAQRLMVRYYQQRAKNYAWGKDKNSPEFQQNELNMLQAQVQAFQGDASNRQQALQTLAGFMNTGSDQSAMMLSQANSAAELASQIALTTGKGSQAYIDAANQAGQAYQQYIDSLYQNMTAQNNANYALAESGTRDPVKLAKLREQNANANLAAAQKRDAMRTGALTGSTGNPIIDQVLKDLKDVAETGKTSAQQLKDATQSQVDTFSSGVGTMVTKFSDTMTFWENVAKTLMHKGTSGHGIGGPKAAGTDFSKMPVSYVWAQGPHGQNIDLKKGFKIETDLKGDMKQFNYKGQVNAKGTTMSAFQSPNDKHWYFVDPRDGHIWDANKQYDDPSKWQHYTTPTGAYVPHSQIPSAQTGKHAGQVPYKYMGDDGRMHIGYMPAPGSGSGGHHHHRHHQTTEASPTPHTMGINQFLAGLRKTEHGVYDWQNNGSGAYGAYQILDTNWPTWAKEAGVNPNDHSKAAQDKVARYKVSQYYNKYHNWRKVAASWYYPAMASTPSKWDYVPGGNTISIKDYVNRVMTNAGSSSARGGSVSVAGGGGTSADAKQSAAEARTQAIEALYAQAQQDAAKYLSKAGVSDAGQLKAQIRGLTEQAKLDATFNKTDWYNDIVKLEQLLYETAQEKINAWKADMQLKGDTSNRAQELGLDARATAKQMQAYLASGGKKSDATYKQLAVQHRDDLRDKKLQQVQYKQDTYTYLYDTHQMGWQSYIEHLRKLAKTVDTSTQAGKELFRQINESVQSLIDSLSGQFNIPDLGSLMPTVYQARKMVGQTGGFYDVTQPIPVSHFATGTDYFGGGTALVGEHGPELVSMPSGSSVVTNANVHSLIHSMSTMSHAVANGTMNACNHSSDGSAVAGLVNQLLGALKGMETGGRTVNIEVNGADIGEVKRLLNSMFGQQATGRVTFAARR